jgi:uncharacterized protein YbcI
MPADMGPTMDGDALLRDEGSDERKISRGVVAIYKDYTGRGPSYASTKITDAYSTTIIRDSLTKAERTLIEQGEAETVRSIRRKFQEAMADEICSLVATVTARECGALLSDHHPEDDVAIEAVMFAEPSPRV